MPRGPDRERRLDSFPKEVDAPKVEREMRRIDDRLNKARFVGRDGRAAFARDGDAAVTPMHRQVTRVRGGPLGTTERVVDSIDRDGRYRLRAARPLSDFGTGALTATELQRIRQTIDQYLVVTNPETD